jgi:hypothetical protein
MPVVQPSEFRVEKRRADAVVTLTTGLSVAGRFFLAEASPTFSGAERIGDLLNSESGFFPFEDESGRTVLYNPDHVVLVEVCDPEARRDPGYAVAAARTVTVLFSNGKKLEGSIRVYRPEGRDRLSDWARHGPRFRYLETEQATFIMNVDHIINVCEVG